MIKVKCLGYHIVCQSPLATLSHIPKLIVKVTLTSVSSLLLVNSIIQIDLQRKNGFLLHNIFDMIFLLWSNL